MFLCPTFYCHIDSCAVSGNGTVATKDPIRPCRGRSYSSILVLALTDRLRCDDTSREGRDVKPAVPRNTLRYGNELFKEINVTI